MQDATISDPSGADDANRTPKLDGRGKLVLAVGAVLFTTSYFLPAVGEGVGLFRNTGNLYSGFEAALFTLGSLAQLLASPMCILLVVTGLPNILAPSYALLRLLRRGEGLQGHCVSGSIAGSVIVWPIFLIFHATPLVGYFTWLAGVALLLAPATGVFDIRETE